VVDLEDAERDALTSNGAPFALAALPPEAEGARLVVAVLRRLVGRFAAQDVDDVHRTEALAGAVHAGEQLLRGERAIEGRRRIETGVAIAARRGGLAEIGEQAHASALGALAQAEHRVELRRLDALLRFTRL
jgi:hypothetical protein